MPFPAIVSFYFIFYQQIKGKESRTRVIIAWVLRRSRDKTVHNWVQADSQLVGKSDRTFFVSTCQSFEGSLPLGRSVQKWSWGEGKWRSARHWAIVSICHKSLVVLRGDHDTESMSWMWLRRKGTPQTPVLNESLRWEENTPKVGLDRDSTMWREMKTTTRRKDLKLRQDERILNVCPLRDITMGRDDPESLSSGKSTWPWNEIPR